MNRIRDLIVHAPNFLIFLNSKSECDKGQ
ncbi:hypothetical protein SBA6_700030 [Candidatus Sulfopaludibacter sp. SbA6]|nr:hypothetical protein SBA6_700030 [Candidatus Sulfopaludibacter sp. SbA6]